MEKDTPSFHGVDSDAYRKSESIRFGHNRFFLHLLAKARGGNAFLSTDNVLDVGCGDATYFSRFWQELVFPKFGRPRKVLGIDKTIAGKDTTLLSDELRQSEIDFFDMTDIEKWDVLYLSSSYTWLRSPRGGRTIKERQDVASLDSSIISRVRTLLKPDGWFAAHYAGETDYFPYYNRLIVEALRQLGHERADENSYFDFRAQHLRVPHCLDVTRKLFAEHGFKTHLLIKTMEWIPLQRHGEFFAYWESGGRVLIEGLLGQDGYQHFRDIISSIIDSPKQLHNLGIKTLPGPNDPDAFVLLPSYHIYQVARQATPSPGEPLAMSDTSTHSHITLPIETASIFQTYMARRDRVPVDLDTIVQAVSAPIETFIDQKQRQFVYLAVIEAGNERRQVDRSRFVRFEHRKDVVLEGRRLGLPTLTNVILASGRNNAIASAPVAAFAHVTDSIAMFIKGMVTNRERYDEISRHWLELSFLWPKDCLCKLLERGDEVATQDAALCRIVEDSAHLRDWPRLIVQSDMAFALLRKLETSENTPDLTGPLRYFLWNSRIAAPKPFSFLVFPQRLKRLGDSGSHTCFLMWQDPDRPTTSITADECALLLAMQPLAMMELAEEAEEVGRREAVSTESHEGRHVAVAVREWPVPIDVFFDVAEAEVPLVATSKLGKIVPYTLSPACGMSMQDLALVAFPELHRAATSYLVSWSLSERPVDLPFWRSGAPHSLPQSIAELVQKCWDSVVDVAFMHCRRDQYLPDAKCFEIFARWRKGILNRLDKCSPNIQMHGAALPLSWDGGSVNDDQGRSAKCVWLARLLIHLSREHLEHANVALPPVIRIESATNSKRAASSNNLDLRLSWTSTRLTSKVQVDEVLREFTEALRSTRKEWRPDRGFRGKDVKQFLARKIDKDCRVILSRKNQNPYTATFEFAW